MQNRSEYEQLCERLQFKWRLMVRAREQGDWATYWAVRRTWLQLGRLMNAIVAEEQREVGAQEPLFPVDVGRRHDSAA